MASTSTDILDGVSSSLAVKAPVRVATTAAITLSGLQTIDGVTVAAGDRVLVKDQADPIENGIYKVSASVWTRAADFNGARDVVQGTIVNVTSGTANAGYFFSVTTANPVIGTTAIAWVAIAINISGLQPGHVNLTSLSSLSLVGNRGIYALTTDTLALYTLTAYGRSLGGVADEAAFKALVNLEAGVDYQAYDADLAAIAALTPTNGNVITGNGTTWTSAAPASTSSVDYQAFTASGTWTKPSGFSANSLVIVECWGGGGGGGGGGISRSGGGGGGGGYARYNLLLSQCGATETVTVAVATSQAASGADGAAGGNTTFGSLATAYGGGGGAHDNTNGGGGGAGAGLNAAGNSATTTTAATSTIGGGDGGTGGSGGAGTAGSSSFHEFAGGGGGGGAGGSTTGGNGGSAYRGGGAGAGGGSSGGSGGVSRHGGAGGARTAAAGSDGTAPGGGGAGGTNQNAGGAGARGECRVWVLG